jgi:two-component sensor histidine kinase/CheY-like chemotaxis protein
LVYGRTALDLFDYFGCRGEMRGPVVSIPINKTKILISEDKEPDYVFTRNILKKIPGNFEISWAANFREAMQGLRTNEFDVCLLDYRLGGNTAIDVLRNLQVSQVHTAFIVFTGMADCGIDNDVLCHGASDYLSKDNLCAESLERSIRYALHRKKYEERAAEHMREKELLLKEIEHRVKNNLQIVSGLLSWQGRETKSKTAKFVFKEAQNRIATMALIHEKLYQTTDMLDAIDFQDYSRDLLQLLIEAYSLQKNDIKAEVEMSHKSLDLAKAVPCGLIISELISNALEHAFETKKRNKRVLVRLRKYDRRLHLCVSDNGKGMQRGRVRAGSFGLKLIELLTKQLGGKIRFVNKNGSSVHIRFPEVTN